MCKFRVANYMVISQIMAAWPAPIWMDRVDPNPNLQPGQMDMDGWMDKDGHGFPCNYLISLSNCHRAAAWRAANWRDWNVLISHSHAQAVLLPACWWSQQMHEKGKHDFSWPRKLR